MTKRFTHFEGRAGPTPRILAFPDNAAGIWKCKARHGVFTPCTLCMVVQASCARTIYFKVCRCILQSSGPIAEGQSRASSPYAPSSIQLDAIHRRP